MTGQRNASPAMLTLKPVNNSATATQQPVTNVTPQVQQSGVRFQLVQHGGTYKG